MTIELYLAFVVATALLIVTPGPMVALIIANSLRYGPRYAFVTVAGSVLAMCGQLTLVSLGLATAMAKIGGAFFWLKWLGVGYLLFLALRSFSAPGDDLDISAAPRKSANTAFWEAALVAATNPKTLIFYGAFFPLFISPTAPAGPQFAVLSATFIVIAAVLDCGWAVFASKARPLVARAGRWPHRIAGGALLAAAAGMAALRK
jgi:threonine/homoserine/homoserine lactone efflux protein